MVQITPMTNGRYIGVAAAEILAVPYYELLHQDPDRACRINQVLFTQIITGLYRRAEPNSVAIEILWQSRPVNDQTYKAQVHQYMILRQMGADRMAVEESLKELSDGLTNDLSSKGYTVQFFGADEEYQNFTNQLSQTNATAVLAVSKKERVTPSMFHAGGIYCTDVVRTSEDLNIADLTNALTQYPNSAVSLQLIPTQYNQNELESFEQGRRFMSYSISSMQFSQGIRADANMKSISDAYEYYVASVREPLFYFNFLVYSQPNSAVSLANRVIGNIEEEGTSDSALELVDVSAYNLRPDKKLASAPWAISNILVYKQRQQEYWGSQTAAMNLIRMKYLMTAREVLGAFKLPIDDGHTIGLDSNKIQANREKLHDSVINNGSFKVGRIVNDSRGSGGEAAHAGIALNDFTKHGLIVGMPGSGKTNFSLGLLLQFWQDYQIPFLAIEPTKSEYRSLLDAIPDLQVFTPGKTNVSPYIINPFLPPRGVTVESYVPSLMSAFKAAFSMPNPLPDIFLGAINDCYNLHGWKSTSTAEDPNVEYFGLYEFIKVFKKRIQNMDYKGEVKSNMESAGVVRLVSLIEQNSNIYDTIHSIPLDDLLRKPTVIELNAINNKEQKSLIMALLLIMICVYTKNNVSGDGKLKNVLLIDEAHVLLGGSGPVEEGAANAKGSTVEALEDMIAEIRSYGTSIIIADQSPTKVGRGVLANTNVKVIFKLVEKENKDAISTATNMEAADYELLGRLGVGEAMLHYGRIYAPLHIKTYNLQEKASIRPVISDQEVAAKSTYWQSHQDLLVPHRECDYNCACCGGCDLNLRADADFVASRLVSEYAYGFGDEKALLQFLVQMDRPIGQILADMPSIQPSLRLRNCIKIKFLRKALLAKSFRFSKADYKTILSHPKFLKKAEQ
ncbi:MAG: ATP-binding protein [Oscillospiraceae bacterium]|nr:ATP-binding protein [Oscillospiraceae bacterium]